MRSRQAAESLGVDSGRLAGSHHADLGGFSLPMKVFLHQPRREIELSGPSCVKALLKRRDLVSESVLGA